MHNLGELATQRAGCILKGRRKEEVMAHFSSRWSGNSPDSAPGQVTASANLCSAESVHKWKARVTVPIANHRYRVDVCQTCGILNWTPLTA